MAWPKISKLLVRQRQSQSSREEHMASSTTILVPLHIYPESNAWDPLHNSIQEHPNTHFVVIINPFNGPGPDQVPDENYLTEIPRLTVLKNVDVVGYVHTTFTQRDLSTVTDDVRTYSEWAEQLQYPGLGISGIFVDETPNQYSVCAEQYLSELTRFAKNCTGFTKKMVIHNPGCVPAPAYMALSDITVVFEDTWPTFQMRCQQGLFDIPKLFSCPNQTSGNHNGRGKLAILIHSVPQHRGTGQAAIVTRQAKDIANTIFITDLDVNYYSNWSQHWAEWVSLLADD